MSVGVFLFCIEVHLYHFLNSTYRQYYIMFVFVWLTLLSMIISRFIHVAANGIIFWLSNIPFSVCVCVCVCVCNTSPISIHLLMDT